MSPTPAKSTQQFVPIKEIREGVVILKDGSIRIVIMASTLNFALKSENEQNAIVLQYQDFLNSLDFTVQFFIESRKLNINPYLATLEVSSREQANELLRIQTAEYIEFIKNFVATTNIVSKTFYVVVPFGSGQIIGGKSGGRIQGVFGGLFGKKGSGESVDTRFEESKLQIQQRADVVSQGLIRSGIRTKQLGTEELIELFYKLFNPGELEKEALKNVRAR